jgi:uncharacterized protein (TIGR03437 family)
LIFFPTGSVQSTSFIRAIPLPNGNRLLIGTQTNTSGANTGRLQLILSAMTPNGSYLETGGIGGIPPGGSGNDVPADVGVDPSGNVWIVGTTNSDNFPLLNPIVATKVPYATAAFVLEMDPTVTTVLFSTYLCGEKSGQSSAATVIAFDSAGSAYVGGSTSSSDFPTTPGAFLTAGGGADNIGDINAYSFLTKISPAGKLVYSTYVGTGTFECSGGSGCIDRESTSSTVGGIAVDSTGAATISEARSYQPATISRLSPDGSKMMWSTQITGYQAVGTSMAQDSTGNVYVLFEYAEELIGFVAGSYDTYGLAANELSNTGSITYTLDLGHVTTLNNYGHVTLYGVSLDSSGNAYFSGSTTATTFPHLAGAPNLGADFVLHPNSTGSAAQSLFTFPTGVIAGRPAMDSSNNLLLLGAQGALLTLPTSYNFGSPMIVGFANSASFAWNTGLFPGTLISIFGYDLGTSATVTVNGVSAPVIYAGPTQLNVIVPFGISPQNSIVAPSMTLAVTLPAANLTVTAPGVFTIGLFTTDGNHGAALNQDGTVNSASNPASAGSVVSLFGTGAVWPSFLQTTGLPASVAQPLDPAANGFVVQSGSQTLLAIPYFGTAPTQYIGLFQANVQLPSTVFPPTQPVSLERLVSPLFSNAVAIYVK